MAIFFGRRTRWIVLAFIPLLLGDSILLSPKAINYHYNKSLSYSYTAASHGNPQAAYENYREYQSIKLLEIAALAGHGQAMWQLHLVKVNGDKNYQGFWLQQAQKSKVPAALVADLDNLIINEKWRTIHQAFDDLPLAYPLTPLQQHIKQVSKLALGEEGEVESIAFDQDPLKASFGHHLQPVLLASAALSNHCEVQILPLVATQDMLQLSLNHIAEFQQVLPEAKDSICFYPPVADYRLTLSCSNKGALLSCQFKTLKNIAQQIPDFDMSDKRNRMMVFSAKTGQANSHGAVIFLDRYDTVEVMIHEIGHWLNLYDEYQLPTRSRNVFCQTETAYFLGENLMIAPRTFDIKDLEQQFQKALYPVSTCDGSSAKAYKFHAELSIMEYLDADITEELKQVFYRPKLNPLHTSLAELIGD